MDVFVFFFFTQKTAYEMRISDWSSDVCSSDLAIFPSGPSTATMRMPLKKSGAPHSSSMTWASEWQKTTPPGRATLASASELAAVPVATKKTATSRSKIDRKSDG